MTTVSRYRKQATEADMEATVRDLVRLRGGRFFHVTRSDLVPELTDLPDWLILLPRPNGAGIVILAEAKSANRRVTLGQQTVLALAAECSRFESFVVRSVNPKDGEISFDQFLAFLGDDEDLV